MCPRQKLDAYGSKKDTLVEVVPASLHQWSERDPGAESGLPPLVNLAVSSVCLMFSTVADLEALRVICAGMKRMVDL